MVFFVVVAETLFCLQLNIETSWEHPFGFLIKSHQKYSLQIMNPNDLFPNIYWQNK